MEIGVAILYIVLGIILGAVGQGARAIIGVKKSADEAAANKKTRVDEWFDMKRLIFSLIIGGIAIGAQVFSFSTVEKLLSLV